MGELQPPDLVGEGLDVLGVATHDRGRGEPAESIADGGRLAFPQRGVFDPEAVEEVLPLEEIHRLLHRGELEDLVHGPGGARGRRGRGDLRHARRVFHLQQCLNRALLVGLGDGIRRLGQGLTRSNRGCRRVLMQRDGRAGRGLVDHPGAGLEQCHLGDLAHEALVALEGCRDPGDRDLDGARGLHLARAQAEDIGVVFLAGEAGGLRVVAEGGADTAQLVGRDGGAGAAAAHQDARVHEAP